MTDPPAPVQWSRHPLKDAPGRGLLVLLILLLVASLVLHALGATAASALLIVALLFSLRDFLLPSSLSIDEEGLRLSSPLTGARFWDWERVAGFERRADGLWLKPAQARWKRLPGPDPASEAALDDWLAWSAANREPTDG